MCVSKKEKDGRKEEEPSSNVCETERRGWNDKRDKVCVRQQRAHATRTKEEKATKKDLRSGEFLNRHTHFKSSHVINIANIRNIANYFTLIILCAFLCFYEMVNICILSNITINISFSIH